MTPRPPQLAQPQAAPPGIEQRRAERHRTMFVVGRIVTPKRERICLVRNLSATGVGVEQSGELPIESEVGIETRTLAQTRAIVRWSTASAAGLEFLEPPRLMNPAVRVLRSGHVPRSPRFGFVRPVRLRVGELSIDTETLDIAMGGVKLRGVDADLPADPARIDLPGAGTLHGRIRWNNSGSAGFQFAAPLSQHFLSSLLDQPWDARQ